MDTDLLLVRHGEAHCNLAGIAGGDVGCTGLTERGRDQARRLGQRLGGFHAGRPFDALYTAPRQRVRETAELVVRHLDLPVTVEPMLSGPHHGAADGRAWTEIWAEFGSSPADQPDRPFADGAESWNQYLARATSCLKRIVTQHAEQRVLVVAHAETVEAAHTLFLRLPAGPDHQVGFTVAHGSITWWSYRTPQIGAARWHLVAHNTTCHLDQPASNDLAALPPTQETTRS